MATGLAQYWTDCLPDSHREALHTALCWLVDDFLGEGDGEDSLLADLLPRTYTLRYNEGFLRMWFVTVLTVGYKLAQPEPPIPLVSCTAEELALRALIEEAKEVLEQEGTEADFGLFEDEAFQDADHEFLFQPEADGIEDSAEGARLGIGHLRFDEWFTPFLNASTQVHPYCTDT